MSRRRVEQLALFEGSKRPSVVSSQARVNTRKSPGSKSAARSSSPAPKPWACVVLAVDTARISGWALYVVGKRVDSGEVDTLKAHALDSLVEWARDLAEVQEKAPAVLVLEAPWGGSTDVVAALGAARERWESAWRKAELPRGRVVRVRPSTWRSAVLGRGSIGMPRDQVRAFERNVASALVGRKVGEDEAPAILIGHWASFAGVVGTAIGKRAQRRSLREWTSNS